jgi:hypothetical protein
LHLPLAQKRQVKPLKMTVQISSRASATRPFVVVEYKLIEGENPVAELPKVCPYADSSDACRCQVAGNYYRDRQTGPEFPLLVAQCRFHRHDFTLYPEGHVPYGRKALAPSALDGAMLQHGEGEDDAGLPMWSETVVDAALDADQGRLWAKSSPSRDEFRRRTQGRWLSLVASLLGLVAQDSRSREQIAEQLGLAALEVMDAARVYTCARGLTERGRVIVGLVDRLPKRRRLYDDLLVCGALIGHWGRPMRWEAGGPLGGVLRALC